MALSMAAKRSAADKRNGKALIVKRSRVATRTSTVKGSFLPEVAELAALTEPYLKRCKEQEDMLVAAGFPIDGITEFYRKWFDAWNKPDVQLLSDCWADDLVWTISGTFQHEFHGRAETVELARVMYDLLAYDVGFYPWDGSDTSLPYYNFIDDTVRITLPWSGSGRPMWMKAIPWPRRPIRGSGIDRYVMSRPDGQWKIARIDTDWDVLQAAYQLLPFANAIVGRLAWLIRTAPRAARRLGLLRAIDAR